jgi:hypothetical protein
MTASTGNGLVTRTWSVMAPITPRAFIRRISSVIRIVVNKLPFIRAVSIMAVVLVTLPAKPSYIFVARALRLRKTDSGVK